MTTMKPAAPPLTSSPAKVDVIDPLRAMLSMGGYGATLLVHRLDGQPMTAEDHERATRLVQASEERDASDEEMTARVRTYLDKTAPAQGLPPSGGESERIAAHLAALGAPLKKRPKQRKAG